jgi:uncharacterized protein YndB with AHSA1/START domain
MNAKATVATMIIAITVIAGAVLAFPLQSGFHIALASDASTAMGEMHLAKGQIGSVQSGATGQPEWIQTGIWVLKMNTSTDSEHPAAKLIARFEMVKPDGTAMHVHKIYNFESSSMTQEGNSTNVLTGTATVTMKNGPVSDVPVTIKVFNNAVIGLWIGPDKVDGHFGTGPVYGTVSTNSKAVMEDLHSMMQGKGSTDGAGANTIKMSATEVNEVYRWSSDDGINPTLKLLSNTNNVIRIQNPTDEVHELVIESDDKELATSGDIHAESSGQLVFKPTMTGTFEYHCEYHPDTMKGTVEVTNPS